jgi:hypothetical protein
MYDNHRSDRFWRNRIMRLFNSRRVAVALAAWHLLLGGAGYSLHVLLGERGQPCSQSVLACACQHDACFSEFATSEKQDATRAWTDGSSNRHDPRTCLLCRWLSQPRVSVWDAVPSVAATPLVWLPVDTAADPLSVCPHPYAARGPPCSCVLLAA